MGAVAIWFSHSAHLPTIHVPVSRFLKVGGGC